MAIRTKYQIFCTKKTAPLLTTYDKVSAYVEFNEHIRNPKGDMYRLAQEVESVKAMYWPLMRSHVLSKGWMGRFSP